VSYWIPAYVDLGRHPKTRRLARALGCPLPHTVGHLLYLWWWAMEYAKDGNLSDFRAQDIADAAEWTGDEALFVAALTSAGWLDECRTLHDWMDYGGKVLARHEANALRMRSARATHPAQRATHVQRTDDARAGHVHPLEKEKELEEEKEKRVNHAQTAPESAKDGAHAPVAASAAPQDATTLTNGIAETPKTKPAPKPPTRYGQVLDALKERGIVYPGGRRDAGEVMKCSATPALIADAYATFEEWCGDYGMSNKSVWYVCQRIAAYQAWRDGKKARANSNGHSSGGQMSASGQQAVLDKLLEDLEDGHSGDDKGAEGAHGIWPKQRAEDQRRAEGGSGRILDAGGGLPVRLVGPTGRPH